MTPLPTGVEPRLRHVSSVRCVLFDIYGTLVVSGSGDVGTLREAAREEKLREALETSGLEVPSVANLLQEFFAEIGRQHEDARSTKGIDYPEVDIVQVWTRSLQTQGCDPPENSVQQLAVEYECGVNPVWPMPNATSVLEMLRSGGMQMGIISNAQSFTRQIFPALFSHDLENCGFDDSLCFYSYIHGIAKPSRDLFERAGALLLERGVEPWQILYVGNDILNDIWPAKLCGFKTALFAGDQRSLRLREAEPRCVGVTPDLVITDLGQLPHCLQLRKQ